MLPTIWGIYVVYHANTWGMHVSWRVSVVGEYTFLQNIYLYWIYAAVLLSMKERHSFFDRLVLEKFFDGKLWIGKDFPKL